MAIGSHKLSEQGAITKRMTAIKEMAGMDVLCSDKTATLTLNKLTVDKSLVEVFAKDMDKDTVLLYGDRASRVENQDAIDACIVGMLSDPTEARAGINEILIPENNFSLNSRMLCRKNSTRERGGSIPVYLNVYDLTSYNGFAYWLGLGVYHSVFKFMELSMHSELMSIHQLEFSKGSQSNAKDLLSGNLY